MATAASSNRYRATIKHKVGKSADKCHVDPIGLKNSSIVFQLDLLDLYEDPFGAAYAKKAAADKARRLAKLRERQLELKQTPARVIRNVTVIKKDPKPRQLEVIRVREAPPSIPKPVSQSPQKPLAVQQSRAVNLQPVREEQKNLPTIQSVTSHFKESNPVGLPALVACLLSIFVLSGAAKYDLSFPAIQALPFDVSRAMPDHFYPSPESRVNQKLSAPAVKPVPVIHQEPTLSATFSSEVLNAGQAAVVRYISKRYRVSSVQAEQIVRMAWHIGREENVEPTLILAIAGIESSYNPTAVSHVGAKGLMQVMDELHQDKFERLSPNGWSPFDPALNIRVGAKIISEYRRRAGSLYEGLVWYVGAAIHRNHGGYPDKVLRLKSYIDTAYANGKA